MIELTATTIETIQTFSISITGTTHTVFRTSTNLGVCRWTLSGGTVLGAWEQVLLEELYQIKFEAKVPPTPQRD